MEELPPSAEALAAEALAAEAFAAEAPQELPASISAGAASSVGLSMSAIVAIVVLIAALIVPLVMLLRAQENSAKQEERLSKREQLKLEAQAAKKKAKEERGTGKKKKGGLARLRDGMKKSQEDDDVEDDEAASGSRRERKAAVAAAAAAAAAAMGEADEEDLDPKAAKEAKREAMRRAREEERERKEAARIEAERLAKEEADRKAKEEFDAWKGMFEVDEGGESAQVDGEESGILVKFVAYVKNHKVGLPPVCIFVCQRQVTNLEELASTFGLKASDAIVRVRSLEQMGHISGVVDDRGKFIYIMRDELEAVARYIKRKGRVRISTLAQESNKLIDLNARNIEEEDTNDDVPAEATSEPS